MLYSCECGCAYTKCAGCSCASHTIDHVSTPTLKKVLAMFDIDPPFSRNHVYHVIASLKPRKQTSVIRAIQTEASKQSVAKTIRKAAPTTDAVRKAMQKLKKAKKTCAAE